MRRTSSLPVCSPVTTVAGLLLLVLLQHAAATTRICLNMMVKDRKDEILKSLIAIGPELAGWTVCDTGSTDGTPELVEGYFKDAKTPGALVHHAWTKDYAKNRNMCLQAGKEWSVQQAKAKGLPGPHFCEYFWMIDSDQFLRLPAGAKPGEVKAMNLTHKAYYVMERNALSQDSIRLVSSRLEWLWEGELHEYVRPAQPTKGGGPNDMGSLPGYWFQHELSGAATRMKSDLQTLTKAVKRNPRDSMSRWYLAKTLKVLGEDEAAIKHFIVRLQLPGNIHFRYASAMEIAHLVQQQHEQGELVSKQVKALLANWDAVSSRISEAEEAEEEAWVLQAPDEDEDDGDGDGEGAGSNATAPPSGDGSHPMANASDALTLDNVLKARKAREFPLVVAAYMAAMQIMPDRPEPWAGLARLHLREQRDYDRCYAYASAGLSQGPVREVAVELDAFAAGFELWDLACTCGYYVDRVLLQGQAACQQLEARVLESMKESPDNEDLARLLARAQANLGFYAEKAEEFKAGMAGSSAQQQGGTAALQPPAHGPATPPTWPTLQASANLATA